MSTRKCSRNGWRGGCCVLAAVVIIVLASTAAESPQPNQALENRVASVISQLPPLTNHLEGLTAQAVSYKKQAKLNYEQLIREKVDDEWFAALISTSASDAQAIKGRFKTWKGFADFIVERDALVELWACSEGGLEHARRIPATEVAQLRSQAQATPLVVTLTYRQPGGEIIKDRVEFGFGAARIALEGQQAYGRERDLQLTGLAILGARDGHGRFSSIHQWQELQQAVVSGRFPIVHMPEQPYIMSDLFVAVEYGVDDSNH